MSKFVRTLMVLVTAANLFALAGCSPAASVVKNRESLFQVSTIESLLAGNYDGIETAANIKTHGDLGVGTFEAVDGEMIIIDGKVYQVKSSGEVVETPDSAKAPFAAVTYFDADNSTELGAVQNLDGLKAELDKMITRKDAFYAIRVDGVFDVKVRSVPKQEKPYPVLSEVTKKQSVFEYKQVKGTLLGFWCPDNVGGMNVPGYHLHFISDDRTRGGHLLEVSFASAKAAVDMTPGFEMLLGQNGGGQAAGNMDTQKEIDKVEK